MSEPQPEPERRQPGPAEPGPSSRPEPRRYETRGSRPRFHRWTVVLVVGLAVLALLTAVLVLTLGGHSGGPARHF